MHSICLRNLDIAPVFDTASPSTIDLLWKLSLLGVLFFSVYVFLRSLLTLLKALWEEGVERLSRRKHAVSQFSRTDPTALGDPAGRVQTDWHADDIVIQNPDLT